jgi:IclR family mhp operon transcriptional activator
MEKGVPIRSITRSIAALRAINRAGSLNMMEIAKASEVPYATACRIVQTLLYEGLIEQEPARKRYRATMLVQTLATGYQQDDALVRAARPHIVELTRRFGWPVSIAVRVGREMMLRDSRIPTRRSRSSTIIRALPCRSSTARRARSRWPLRRTRSAR